MFLSTSCRYLACLPLATFFPSTVQVRIPEKCGADFGEFITLTLALPTANISLESSPSVNPDLHSARELHEGTKARENIGCVFLGGVHGSLMTKALGWPRSLQAQRDLARGWQVSVRVWGP